MSNHGYHTRNNTPLTERQTHPQSNVSTDKSSNNESSQISRLEAKLLSRFDNLSTEFLNLKDIIIKNLQIEIERLRKPVSYLNKKVVSLEANNNILEQYGRRNNIEITGIPDSVQDNQLEKKVIEIFDAIGVDAKSVDFEDCHRVGKSKNNSKKVIARFVNRKVVKNAFYKRKQLRTIDKTSIVLHNATIFLNENLTPENNKIAYHCRKLKRDGTISKTYTSNGTNIICCNLIKDGKPQKDYHVNDLCEMFPDIDFGNDDNNYSGDPAKESLQSSH